MKPKVIDIEKAKFTDWLEKALDTPLHSKKPAPKPKGKT